MVERPVGHPTGRKSWDEQRRNHWLGLLFLGCSIT
jgi:hypothetical protein